MRTRRFERSRWHKWAMLSLAVLVASASQAVADEASVIGSLAAAIEEAELATTTEAACVPTQTRACLQGGRFAVTLDWQGTQAGQGGAARVASAGTPDTALFYFFGANNWELLVKVLNACKQNDHFWVFGAAATNFGYTLRVEDTQTGAVKTYTNQVGTPSGSITDTKAFATCDGDPVPPPPPASCPVNGPLTDLRKDCSRLGYGYIFPGGTLEALYTTDGSTAAACYADGIDVFCTGGPVASASQATLVGIQLNGGPIVPLQSGSFLRLIDGGFEMDIRQRINGETFDFFGWNYADTVLLSTTASESPAENPDLPGMLGLEQHLTDFLEGDGELSE